MLTILLSAFSWIVMQAKKHKEWFAIIGILIFAVALIAVFRSCRTKPMPEIDQEKVVKIQRAIEAENRAEMEKQAAEIKAKQEIIDEELDGNIKAAEEAEAKAKADIRKMTDAELKAYLLERINR